MKTLFKIIKTLLALIIGLVLVVVLYINLHPAFGDSPNAESRARIRQSGHFDGEHFKNLVPTQAFTVRIDGKQKDNSELFKNFLFPPEGKNPDQPLPTEPLKAQTLNNGEFVWLGHSTVLFRTNNTTILTDPVFHNAAPIPWAFRPFDMTNTPHIDDLPFIDAILISHDHYDHLDYRAIKALVAKTGHFFVPLGVKAHLLRWGVPDTQVSEYDWYEDTMVNDIQLVFTPSRHFSGRGVTNRNQTLWGSWTVIAPDIKVYFSGDGGYSPEFAKIGQRYGGFDIAFMEDGAYNVRWQSVHMLPEQSAQAAIDLQAKIVLPIHWSKFDLSTHPWTEPVQRIKQALTQHNDSVPQSQHIQLATPKIGQTFSLNTYPQTEWWTAMP
ncbi:MAG: multidrug transporter [Flavobacteriia bacterium]|nr:MAG: multidrug transporter [Flavobacteriia bacterium]